MSACCSDFGSNKCQCNCWPVDPRAPKMGHIFFNCDEVLMQKLQAFYEREFDNSRRGKMVIMVGSESQESLNAIQHLYLNIPEAKRPFPIIELAKIEMEELVIKEENSRFSGKVTQRDQRNRERFNKNRKWK
jgi:Cu/Ag efflux pump CusA